MLLTSLLNSLHFLVPNSMILLRVEQMKRSSQSSTLDDEPAQEPTVHALVRICVPLLYFKQFDLHCCLVHELHVLSCWKEVVVSIVVLFVVNRGVFVLLLVVLVTVFLLTHVPPSHQFPFPQSVPGRAGPAKKKPDLFGVRQ
jgi:hypothetical protein